MTNLIERRKQLGHYLDPKSELNTRISILKDYRAECTGLVQVAGSQKDSFDVLQSKCSILVSGQGVVFMYDWNSAQWNVSDKQFDQFSYFFFFFLLLLRIDFILYVCFIFSVLPAKEHNLSVNLSTKDSWFFMPFTGLLIIVNCDTFFVIFSTNAGLSQAGGWGGFSP